MTKHKCIGCKKMFKEKDIEYDVDPYDEDILFIREQVKQALLSVKREGMIDLINYLGKTDYLTAPASISHHLNTENGLLLHHWHLYEGIIEKNKLFHLDINKETMILCSLTHDICKCNLYPKKDEKYTYNAEVGNKGHGKLSVERIKKFIKLTEEEEAVIKFHMSCFGLKETMGEKGEYTIQEMHEAIKRFPLVQIFASTDMECTQMEGKQEQEETIITKKIFLKVLEKMSKGKAISKGIQTRYQSDSPGKYWIKISDANKLREKALKEQAKEIFEDLNKITSFKCSQCDHYGCGDCEKHDKEFIKELKKKYVTSNSANQKVRKDE